MLRATVAEGAPYRVRDLAVGGADVMGAFGGRPGPWVGMALESCLREVVHGRVGNTREELLGWLVGQRE